MGIRICAVLWCSIALAFAVSKPLEAAGQLDPLFGDGGRHVYGFDIAPNFHDVALAVVAQSDGKLVIVGAVQVENHRYATGLIRLSPGGQMDTTFGTGGPLLIRDPDGQEMIAYGAAVQADDRVVISLLFAPTSPTPQWWLARVLADGSGLDPSFGSGGRVRIASDWYAAGGFDVTLQPDGKILAVGLVADAGIDRRMAVARLHPNGSPDTGFAGGSGLFQETFDAGHTDVLPFAILRQPDGRILVAGQARKLTGDGDMDMALLRLLSDGSPDASFGAMAQPGRTTIDFTSGDNRSDDLAFVLAYRAQFVDPAARRILVGGVAIPTDGSLRQPAVAVLNYDGSLATDFSVDGKKRFGIGWFDDAATRVSALVLERRHPQTLLGPAEHIIVGGTNTAPFGPVCFVTRIDFTGAPDPRFNNGAISILQGSQWGSADCHAGMGRSSRFFFVGATQPEVTETGNDFVAFAVLAGYHLFRDGFEGSDLAVADPGSESIRR